MEAVSRWDSFPWPRYNLERGFPH